MGGFVDLSSPVTATIPTNVIINVASMPLTAGAGGFLNGINGVEFDGAGANDEVGQSLATGDVNDDGISDLIIGAYGASTNGPRSGSAYVVFGQKTGWSGAAIKLDSNLLNDITGIEFDGATAPNYVGYSVAAADANGDGIADLIIGAPYVSPKSIGEAGSTYVYYGKKSGWPTSPYNLGGL